MIEVLFALAAVAGLQAPGPQAADAGLAARIEAAVSATMRTHGIPGLTAAVAAGAWRWSDGFGMADVENSVPARTATVYRLASITKPLTATAVLQLAERGRLDLDAPIQKYVPEFPEKTWPVTPRQLLCHQGGIRNWTEDEFGNTRRYGSVAEAVEPFRNDPLVHEPGTRALYSSLGYTLLGRLIEAASGTSYAEFLKQNVLDPAGMESTRPDDPAVIIPNRAAGYRKVGGALYNSALSDTSNRLPGGGVASTAEDVARFASALQAGVLLKPETVARMVARQRLKDGTPTGFGLGFAVGTRARRREAYHLGGQPQVTTILYMRPDQGLTVVLLCNLEGVGGPLTELARNIADMLER